MILFIDVSTFNQLLSSFISFFNRLHCVQIPHPISQVVTTLPFPNYAHWVSVAAHECATPVHFWFTSTALPFLANIDVFYVMGSRYVPLRQFIYVYVTLYLLLGKHQQLILAPIVHPAVTHYVLPTHIYSAQPIHARTQIACAVQWVVVWAAVGCWLRDDFPAHSVVQLLHCVASVDQADLLEWVHDPSADEGEVVHHAYHWVWGSVVKHE